MRLSASHSSHTACSQFGNKHRLGLCISVAHYNREEIAGSQRGLRIRAIIEWLAGDLKGRAAVPVWTSDVYPTLVATASVASGFPTPLDGTDISNIITGSADERSEPMGFWDQFQ